jgi:hypothetical protein
MQGKVVELLQQQKRAEVVLVTPASTLTEALN